MAKGPKTHKGYVSACAYCGERPAQKGNGDTWCSTEGCPANDMAPELDMGIGQWNVLMGTIMYRPNVIAIRALLCRVQQGKPVPPPHNETAKILGGE